MTGMRIALCALLAGGAAAPALAQEALNCTLERLCEDQRECRSVGPFPLPFEPAGKGYRLNTPDGEQKLVVQGGGDGPLALLIPWNGKTWAAFTLGTDGQMAMTQHEVMGDGRVRVATGFGSCEAG